MIGSADVALHLALGRRSNVPPASRGLGDMVSLLTCQIMTWEIEPGLEKDGKRVLEDWSGS